MTHPTARPGQYLPRDSTKGNPRRRGVKATYHKGTADQGEGGGQAKAFRVQRGHCGPLFPQAWDTLLRNFTTHLNTSQHCLDRDQ